MKRIIIIVIELCFIVVGFFAANAFVENVLDSNYTVNWQSRTEWEAEGSIGGVPPDKKMSEADIMQKRQTDRIACFVIFGLLVAGYYCAKAARNEIKRRGIIILADGTEFLNTAITASNRRIALMRFLSVLLCMSFLISATIFILGHPMQDVDKTGHFAVVNKNPYWEQSDTVSKLLISMYMPVAICLAPYFVFRKITNILSFRFCFSLFVTVVAIMTICVLLRLPRYYGSVISNVVSGLGIAVSFNQKMNAVAKVLGMGK